MSADRTTSKARLKILESLKKLYPDASTELVFKGPYQLAIAVMLSAQCTDKKVNQVTPALFERCPNFETLSLISLSELEKIINQINYYKTKAKHLIETAQIVREKHHGDLPHSMEELIELPGIGRKTASVILGELGIVPTLPVDTHVFRVSKRLGISTGRDVREVEDSLRHNFDSKYWRPLHHQLILHGRRICIAQRPKCSECELSKLCPSAEVISTKKR